MRRNFPLAIALLTLFACAVVDAKLVAAPGEQITSFEADIVVNPDATLTVREDFVVHSEGSYFKYGFIRILPIDDEARWDERYAGKWTADNGIRVKILELTENGASVSYQQGGAAGYPQLRIGPRDAPLAQALVRSLESRQMVSGCADGTVSLLLLSVARHRATLEARDDRRAL